MARPPPLTLNLSDLTSFNKKHLKRTETLVTHADGSKEVEGVDAEGLMYRRPSESDSPGYGFVLDMAEDLQVAEIRPGLIMGSQDVAHNLEKLQQYSVTHILNVACGVDNIFPDKVIYQTQEFRDLPDFPIFQGFQEAIEFIDKAFEASGCTLVHCNAGISRSASIVIAYLMKKENMTLNKALSLLRSKRPVVCPNPGFMIQLEMFYESLHPELKRGATDSGGGSSNCDKEDTKTESNE